MFNFLASNAMYLITCKSWLSHQSPSTFWQNDEEVHVVILGRGPIEPIDFQTIGIGWKSLLIKPTQLEVRCINISKREAVPRAKESDRTKIKSILAKIDVRQASRDKLSQ